MTRKVSQTATKPINRSGIAHPASTPSIQFRNQFRQRGGESSARIAATVNAPHIATQTHRLRQATTTVPHSRPCERRGFRHELPDNLFMFIKKRSCPNLSGKMSQLELCFGPLALS